MQPVFTKDGDTILDKAFKDTLTKILESYKPKRIKRTDVLQQINRIRSIASKFLMVYRKLLEHSAIIRNLHIPAPGSAKTGYSAANVYSTPLLGAIGLPDIHLVDNLIKAITINSGFVQLTWNKTKRGYRGLLVFDFNKFAESQFAVYHDGRKKVSWVSLIEYGFDVFHYVYVRHGLAYSRSGYGIMTKSKTSNFIFPPTYVFRMKFEEAKGILPPAQRRWLRVKFIG
ncbi:MAG: hypothetical protein DRP85_00780 [Candidatus Makaraimicrobium thalassicum]|nr:MAG: hypothetical protein DRP85_00780 [Candidatus Omnitrophota bacterium]